MLPLVARFQIRKKGGREKGFWLPLFLLWPLFFVFLGCAFPFIIFRKRGGLFLGAAWGVLTALRGVMIDVENGEERIKVYIY